MKTREILMAALATSLLAACDAVRVPGIDRPAREAPAGPAATPEPAAPAASLPAGPPTQAPPVAAPAPVAEPAPLPVPVQTAQTVVSSLLDINAVSCGLPPEAEPTLTVAQLSELPEGTARPESLLQAQVVGAAAIVASLDPFPGIVKMEPLQFRPNGIVASGHCGATRIADNWFMTAAHCIDQGYDEIRFIAGTTNLRQTETAQIFNAEAAICNAGYFGQDTDMINDIALVRVSDETMAAIRNIPVASFGRPDKLLTQENYPQLQMAGWGTTSYGSLPSERLLSASLNLVSASPGIIVIESTNGQGPCEGDSGGPLYVTEEDGQRRVVGVLSNVLSQRGQPPCTGLYRGRYTNVAGYEDWIRTVVAVCDGAPELCRN